MGRVFSYEAIAAGKVPQPEDFAQASKLFLERIGESVADGTVDGGFVFGSVGRGSANSRSDFDAFISLNSGASRSYEAARDIVQSINNESSGKILVEPIAYPKATLASGQHEIDYLFGRHLLSGFRLVEGNDPAEYLAFPNDQARDVFAGYASVKARKLSALYVTADSYETAGKGLQRMLELPNSLGRKALAALQDAGYLEKAAEASEKPAVFRQSDELFRAHGLHDGFRKLAAANDEYSELLQEAVEGRVDQQTYDAELVRLHGLMPFAIEWIRQVGQTLLPLFYHE